MKRASITEAKNNFSALIAKVRRGESIMITDRDQPVARIEPVTMHESDGAHFGQLVKEGVLIPPRKKLPKSFLKRRRVKSPPGASLLQAVLDERAEGR